MRKILLLLAILWCATTVQASKAWPYPMTFTQSDGSQITVYLHGDADYSWYTDTEGNLLQRVGNDFKPMAIDPNTFYKKVSAARRASAMRREKIDSNASLTPHTGNVKVCIILAEFADKKFTLTDPVKSFNQFLNKTDDHPESFGFHEEDNYYSVKKYFEDMSFGQFTPDFDVYGPVTVDQPMAYYGGTDAEGRDEKYQQFMKDVLAKAEPNIDFSQYDSNQDGNVDCVYVIFAGRGQNMGGANETLWSKSFSMSGVTLNGKKIMRCGINNELLAHEEFDGGKPHITSIGVFCHEFSHCLGLPDFYNTSPGYHLDDNQGMEDWDLMDNGEYVRNGCQPTAYTAWEREAMGWLTIDTLKAPGTYQLTSIDNGGKAYRIVNEANPSEYYVVQYFRNEGWNTRIGRSSQDDPKAEGLLLYHVDYNPTTFSLSSNSPNNIVGKPGMTVVPADGRLISSYRLNKSLITRPEYNLSLRNDIFANGVSIEADSDLPNYQWHTASTPQTFHNITFAKEGYVYFGYNQEVPTTIEGIDEAAGNSESDSRVYTLDGRYMGHSLSNLPKGIYIKGHKKYVVR